MATSTAKDYYQVLGVPDASADEIKRAFPTGQGYHPDANPKCGRGGAIQEIGGVRDPLRPGEAGPVRPGAEWVRSAAGFHRGPAGAASRMGAGSASPSTTSETRRDRRSLLLFFDQSETTARRGPQAQNAAATSDTSSKSLSRSRPMRKIPIRVPVTDDCAVCQGTGNAPGSRPTSCAECGGTGMISFGQGGFAVNRPCPACYGRGQIPTDPCHACRGSGQVREQRKIVLTVPPGVDNNSRLRLSGQGERGTGRGAPGDLIVTFRVKPHRFFRREGLDIHCTVPINIAQAALGSTSA